MTVLDVIELARGGELNQLAIKEDSPENVALLLGFINLGLIELHKRFNIKTNVEVLKISPVTPIYNLRNLDVLQILSVYGPTGEELTKPAHLDDTEYDYKQLTYNTLLLTTPTDIEIVCVYQASSERVVSVDDTIYIPDAMLEALLHYIGYRAHGAVDGNINSENNTHYMRFEKSCKFLTSLGYNHTIDPTGLSTQSRGFV